VPEPGARASRDLRLVEVTKTFGDFVAVDDLTLTIPAGSFFALLGPSGCGKTTTLRMTAGLEVPTAGQVLLGDEDISGLRPYKRPVNTVFQSYALFPHLSIEDNVAFGLRRRGIKDTQRRVGEMLELVELEGFGRRRPGSSTTPRCCCWTSRSARWTSSCDGRCSWSSSASRPRSASPSCT
jgi:spermidine/putrescine transport system ATP-binding protein